MKWSELVREVAQFAQAPIESIDRETLLIEDLGLDSLALTELLVILIEEHQLDALAGELFERNWENVTVAELFERYCKEGLLTDELAGSPDAIVAN